MARNFGAHCWLTGVSEGSDIIISTCSMCEEAGRLLGFYTAALSEFHDVQAPLLRGLNPNSPEFAGTMQAKDASQAVLLQARRLYWDHVRSHGCRERPAGPEEKPARHTEDNYDSLWRQVQDTKRGLDQAHDAVHEAREELRAEGLPTADGHYAYRQAIRAQDRALQLYHAALGGLKAALVASQTGRHNLEAPARSADRDPGRAGVLTRREREVLTHIASGKSSREIAGLLGIAFKTVVVHRHHIQTKLDVHNTADLTRTALRLGLIEP